METRELILTVLVLYSSTVSLILAQNETTYLRELPTGQKLLCNRCPPGYRLQKHCTATHQTICKPCDAGLYTEVWNYIYECLPCRWCRPDQVEVQKCTNSTNRVCGCKEGFYLDSDICRPHSVCPSGYRVKEKGTPDRDTVCEHCQKGFHADGQLGNALCVPYSECKSEEKLLLHGTIYMDNVCVTCNRITCDDWVKFIIQPFTAVFKNHSTCKLFHFIGRLTTSKCGCVFRSVVDQDFCFQQLEEWFSKATEQQVSNLPRLLQKASIRDLAKNIKQRIMKIRNEVRLCRNTLPARK
ncbi:hypothetical protein KOW79_012577 [Hemibagrus wyckioides]|uniref:TNFR-Cys domain-containing protein n=1 Tax=Hemibagrus wyckioides TaxID=337641 RepID=A0A9D3SHI1_9TELE|nr:tumor necrosis factor receptor superfamily member 11B-like isoform X1 [Hemibagrus wyckioides]KAG7324561.1 hypothetical protein KOW79_012577 [Hemibagrus wyckioides]